MSLIQRSEPRNISFTTNINPYAQGSVMAQFGNTKVHITAVLEEGVPPFLKGSNKGWLTAEYNMLPSSTHTRNKRERNNVGGRTQEIQRLIGRSLRSVIDFHKLGERTIMIDCDVMVADGGTRTTSISGAYVAVALAVKKLMAEGKLQQSPLGEPIAAISVGINKQGKVIADLNYEEDSSCDTDMNVVMTKSGKFVEVQGTAEGAPFDQAQLQALIECSKSALEQVFKAQAKVLN